MPSYNRQRWFVDRARVYTGPRIPRRLRVMTEDEIEEQVMQHLQRAAQRNQQQQQQIQFVDLSED